MLKQRFLRSALMVVGMSFLAGGCAVLEQKALDPIDWADQSVERLQVSGKGGWARLQNKPLLIGRFAAIVDSMRPWGHLPVETTTDTQVGVGGESGRQMTVGNNALRNESELKVRLYDREDEVAVVHCRELLNIENHETRVTNSKGEDNFKITENISHYASLSCRSRAVGEHWPRWQMELNAEGREPLMGTLKVDGALLAVVGSRASSLGVVPETVSYEVRDDESVLALIDRSGDGLLSLVATVSETQRISILGAAAVLLLAQDPLRY